MDKEELIFKSIENEEDVKSTLHFLEKILSHKIDKKIWEWEFNSFPDETVLTIINDKTETVGTQFMLPVKLAISGIELVSGKCENSYFDDRYRGQGLFQKLFAYASEVSVDKSMKFLWAFTPAIKVYESKLGFSVFSASMYNYKVLVGKPTIKFIQSFTKSPLKSMVKYMFLSLKYSAFIQKRTRFATKTNFKKEAEFYLVKDEVISFEEINSLYDLINEKQGNMIHIKVDQPFFEWRIKNNVNLKYITKYFYRDGRLIGYYNVALKGFLANISDFTSEDNEVSEFMMNHLLFELKNKKVFYLNYFGNIENALNKRNFELLKLFGGEITHNEGMPFVYKNISKDNTFENICKDPKNWYLNGLWTEGFSY